MTAAQLDAYTRDDDLRDLYASPRYLAGTGNDLDTAMKPLLEAGFSLLRGQDGEAFLHSECHRVLAAFIPEGDDYGLWHVTVAAGSMPMHLPRWKATFDDGIPIEAVAAFTAALADELSAERDGPGNQRFLFAPWGAPPGWYPLGEAGWRSTASEHEARLTSPDGQAELVCTRAGLTYAGEMGPGPHAWNLYIGTGRFADQATFTSGTPTQLIAAFTAALVDPAPVLRTRAALPRRHLPHLTVRPAEAAAALTAPPHDGAAAAVAAHPARTHRPPTPPASTTRAVATDSRAAHRR